MLQSGSFWSWLIILNYVFSHFVVKKSFSFFSHSKLNVEGLEGNLPESCLSSSWAWFFVLFCFLIMCKLLVVFIVVFGVLFLLFSSLKERNLWRLSNIHQQPWWPSSCRYFCGLVFDLIADLDGLTFSLLHHHQFLVAFLPYLVSCMQKCPISLVVSKAAHKKWLFFLFWIKIVLPHPVGARLRSWLITGIFQMLFLFCLLSLYL